MVLNKKASFMFLIAIVLFFILSMFMPADASYGTLVAVSAFAVSIPAFLLPAVIYRRSNRFPLFPAPKGSHVLIAVGLGLGCICLNLALSFLIQGVTFNMEVESTAVDVAKSLEGSSLPLMILTVAVIPAVSEEFLMRGALLETWKRTSVGGAMVLTSVLFALLHSSPSNIIVYFAIGMLLAAVYVLTGNVWLTIIIHFINNLLSLLSVAILMAEDASEASAALDASEELTQVQCFSYFFSWLLIAAVMIVPLLILLKNSCQKHGLGVYSAKAEPLPAEAVGETAEVVPAAPGEPSETRGRSRLLADPILWVAIIFLAALNVFAALIEFGVINVALE